MSSTKNYFRSRPTQLRKGLKRCSPRFAIQPLMKRSFHPNYFMTERYWTS